jgi:metal-dependent amidase/aminoacylase/carboxypeptidase family protein
LSIIDGRTLQTVSLDRTLWVHAELGFLEQNSSELLQTTLAD